MTQHKIQEIIQLINDNWRQSNAWPDFIQAMRLVLPKEEGFIDLDHDHSRWALLPELCCQAAGGDPKLTKEVSAAWLLLYIAAHLVDNVEDDDIAEEVNELGGKGPAINVANGLFLSVALLLNQLHNSKQTKNLAAKITTDFFNTILVMTSGQQLDLTTDLMSLEQWRLVAEAKSGAFFSLACRSGAQLALDDPSKIKGYSDFGFHLGLMLQVHDDFEDLQTLVAVEEINFPINLQRSLAVAYAMDVLPESDITRLERRIQSFYYEPETVEDVIEILDNCGAGLYMIAELERHNNMAITSLAAVNPSSPAGEKLLELLSKLSLA